jgi:hypothetical protein
MRYEIREVTTGGYSYSRGYYCSIKAAQKALGIPEPNGIDCNIRMQGEPMDVDGKTHYRAEFYTINRVYDIRCKL